MESLDLTTSAQRLRIAKRSLLACSDVKMVQRRSVQAIGRAAENWLLSRKSPDDLCGHYPASMIWHSLEPLLKSMSELCCLDLITSEGVLGQSGPELIGHVIASNTPLVGITSVVRALCVSSASLVKMPLKGDSRWLDTFLKFLASADNEIANMVEVTEWGRLDESATVQFVSSVDFLIVYGGVSTIDFFSTISEGIIPLLPYGHRASAAAILKSADPVSAAKGLADDILLYDQAGCLSPHCVFVEGDANDADDFARQLASALRVSWVPKPEYTADRAAAFDEFVALTSMDSEASIVDTENLRWAVIRHSFPSLHLSVGHGNVYVAAASKEGIIELTQNASSVIQGMALAAGESTEWNTFKHKLLQVGVSYVCYPGNLQQPPLSWRENNLDVLATLIDVRKQNDFSQT